MAETISSTDLSHNLSEILSRVQHRGESFTVIRNGKTIARLSPAASSAPAGSPASATAATTATPHGSWRAFAQSVRHHPLDPSFADDLADIQRGQAPAELPEWPSS